MENLGSSLCQMPYKFAGEATYPFHLLPAGFFFP